MSNTLFFIGRLGSSVTLTSHANGKVGKFTLIRNESRGKDREPRVISIQFTAFDGVAESLAEHAAKGDQLFVEAAIENTRYENKEGETVYGYNFKVQHFEFCAPGPATRERLAKEKAAA